MPQKPNFFEVSLYDLMIFRTALKLHIRELAASFGPDDSDTKVAQELYGKTTVWLQRRGF